MPHFITLLALHDWFPIFFFHIPPNHFEILIHPISKSSKVCLVLVNFPKKVSDFLRSSYNTTAKVKMYLYDGKNYICNSSNGL